MTTRTAPRSELSRDRIVIQALAIADSEGMDAITIRRLANEFGVTPMALYWHVKNKDELLEAMGDRFFEEIGPLPAADDPAAGDRLEQLRTILHQIIEPLRRHPGAAHLAGHRVLACDAGREVAERFLALLRDEGFSVAQAADVARTAMQTAVMLVTEQAGAEPEVAAEARAAVREAKRSAIAGLSPARFPNLVACADALTSCEDDDAYFSFGVDLFMAGVDRLRARAAASNPSTSPGVA